MKRTLSACAALIVLCATAGSAAAASAAENKCRLGRAAELPVTMHGMRPMVTLTVNGQETPFELDSGAWHSLVSDGWAKRLKLRTVPDTSLRMEGIGGAAYATVGIAKEITFSGTPVKDVPFVVSDINFGGDSAGLLGQNFLRMFDVEYDMANGVVRLFIPHDCKNVGLGYWADGAANIMQMEEPDEINHKIQARGQLNGQKIKILFDTGASTTILDKDAADRAGVPSGAEVEAAGVTRGIGKGLVDTWVAPIADLDLGDEQIKKTHIRVGALRMTDSDMLMGMDFFLSHRVLVSNSQRKIYFTYNGGPVFDIGRKRSSPVQTAAGGASRAEDDKLDASALTRRAAASMSRRDFTAALADYDRALKMQPDDVGLLLGRASAHEALGDTKAGMADVDQVLKLKPDNLVALMVRAHAALLRGDLKAAQEDFAAASKAAPDNEGLRLGYASALGDIGRHDLAIAEFSRWIDEHPKDRSLWRALNGRCWERASAGLQLQEALTDCEQAVKLGGGNQMALDSRGMAHLRLGQFQAAVADYDAALKKQNHAAWSYLGRGLAKEKLGDARGAAADLKQAASIEPGIAAEAGKMGLRSALLPMGDKPAVKVAEKAAG